MFNISQIAKTAKKHAIEKTLTPAKLNKIIEQEDIKLIKLGFSVAERKKLMQQLSKQIKKYADNL